MMHPATGINITTTNTQHCVGKNLCYEVGSYTVRKVGSPHPGLHKTGMSG